jgi:hypothetical protein
LGGLITLFGNPEGQFRLFMTVTIALCLVLSPIAHLAAQPAFNAGFTAEVATSDVADDVNDHSSDHHPHIVDADHVHDAAGTLAVADLLPWSTHQKWRLWSATLARLKQAAPLDRPPRKPPVA